MGCMAIGVQHEWSYAKPHVIGRGWLVVNSGKFTLHKCCRKCGQLDALLIESRCGHVPIEHAKEPIFTRDAQPWHWPGGYRE